MKTKEFLKKLTWTDAAALGLFVALFTYMGYTALLGFGSIDESCYYSIAHRLLLGDRLLVDDWHVSQLSSVLEVLPYWAYLALTGSTRGVILYLRFFYLAVTGILYWFFYLRFRSRGVWGLLPVALFCAFTPSSIMMLNYYTMALQGLMVLCALLLMGKPEKSVYTLFLAGVVLACAVLAEPFLAGLYLLFSLSVLVRRLAEKQGRSPFAAYAFVLNGRTWLWITLGILPVAVVFSSWLLIRSPLPEILKNLPEMFTDHEYAFQGEGSKLLDFAKITDALRFYGWFPPVLGFALAPIIAVCAKKKNFPSLKRLLFILVCLCLAGAYAFGWYRLLRGDYLISARSVVPPIIHFYYFQGLPILFFGLDCYLLCEKREPRLFCFWAVGFAASLLIDLSSELVLGICAAVTFPAAVLSLQTVLAELGTADQKKPRRNPKKQGAAAWNRIVGSAALLLFCCWQGTGLYALGFCNVVEQLANISADKALTVTAERGPLSGIRTTALVAGRYADMLEDLDRIKASCNGPVYVSQLCCYDYMYLNLPVGSYSTWYVEEDSETRQLQYWELHPDRRPDCIYIPLYDCFYNLCSNDIPQWEEKKLSFFSSLCEFSLAEGKAGYILTVLRWYE